MRGHVKKRGKDSYTVWIELPRLDGKRRRETLTVRGSRKEADAKLAKRIVEIEAGIVGTGSDTTVRQFMATWIARKRESDLAYSTVDRYAQIVERFIDPILGKLIMTKLRPLHIEGAVAAWRRMPHAKDKKRCISQRTVHHIYSVLRTALNQAQRWSVIDRNPCANVERVAKGRSTGKAIDETQALRLIERLRGDPLEFPTLLALMTGLRRGELLALRWSDVDLEKGALRVCRSLEVVGLDELRFKEPKTAKSVRTVALPSQAVAALKRHRAIQREHIMRYRDVYVDQDMIFPAVDGLPWHPKRFSAAFFRRMKALEVDVSFHGLRHSYASILLRAGTPLKIASEALGHTSVAITADLYTHVLGGLQRDAADRLGSVFEAAQIEADSAGQQTVNNLGAKNAKSAVT